MRFLLVLTIFFFTQILYSQDLVVKGIYQGDNVYVMNPFSPTGVGFCVYQVLVNGQPTHDEIHSSAFEIDLSAFNLKIGDPVTIVLKHHEGCRPKILNPEVLKPRSTFNLESIKIDPKNKKLIWVTSGELGSLPFIVEQYRWNKWVKVATVKGKGTPGIHTYSVNIHFHSGLNRFRIKQVDYTKKPRYSPVVTYKSNQPPVKFKPGNGKRVSDKIVFTAKTDYEIYDYYGRLMKKGYGKEVDVSDLPKGTYFLNYDNKTEIFIKK